MGHSQTFTLALLAAMAAGCVADAGPGEPVRVDLRCDKPPLDEPKPPADRVVQSTCTAGERFLLCYGAAEADELDCVVPGTARSGIWWSYSGGEPADDETGWHVIYAGGALIKRDCRDEQPELLPVEWCED